MSPTSRVLIWNRGERVRTLSVEGASHTFHRGLNLLDVEQWRALDGEAARCTDIVELGTDIRTMDVELLVQAISDTKQWLHDASSFEGFGPRAGAVALAWLAQQEMPTPVSRALTLAP
jgi:hypothetical protein